MKIFEGHTPLLILVGALGLLMGIRAIIEWITGFIIVTIIVLVMIHTRKSYKNENNKV